MTEEEKKKKLEDLRSKLAEKRAVQSDQDKTDKKRNEVWNDHASRFFASILIKYRRKSGERATRNPRILRRTLRRRSG